MSPITELTEFQFTAMDTMANTVGKVLSYLHPREDDSTSRFNEFSKAIDQMKILVDLGLVREVSDQYQLIREAARHQHGRDLSFFELTPVGKKMFEDYEKRMPN